MPDDEAALRKDINRADRAKALLEDPLLNEAFDKLKAECLKAIEESAPTDTGGREKLFFAMRVVPAVKHNLGAIMRDGDIARKQLANLEEDKARAKRKA